KKERGPDRRGGDREPSGRDRTAPLGRVKPVALDVQDVVQDVHARDGDREEEKSQDRVQDERRVEELEGEDEAGEENEVLRPLMDPHRFYERADDRPRFGEGPAGRAVASARSQQMCPTSRCTSWMRAVSVEGTTTATSQRR